jgi:hypothetical protein
LPLSTTECSSDNNDLSIRCFATISPEQQQPANDREETTTKQQHYRPPRWLRTMQNKAASNKPIDSQKAYRYLRLEKFTEDELEERFGAILASGEGQIAAGSDDDSVASEHSEASESSPSSSSTLNQERLRYYLTESIRREERDCDEALFKHNNNNNTVSNTDGDDFGMEASELARIDWLRNEYIDAETKQLWQFLTLSSSETMTTISRAQFVERLTDSAKSLDQQRLWPLSLSMVMIGLSVGVSTPAFPFVVQNLGLSTGEYGMVVSAFALTKLLGNIPFAVLVERHGRKVRLCVCANGNANICGMHCGQWHNDGSFVSIVLLMPKKCFSLFCFLFLVFGYNCISRLRVCVALIFFGIVFPACCSTALPGVLADSHLDGGRLHRTGVGFRGIVPLPFDYGVGGCRSLGRGNHGRHGHFDAPQSGILVCPHLGGICGRDGHGARLGGSPY